MTTFHLINISARLTYSSVHWSKYGNAGLSNKSLSRSSTDSVNSNFNLHRMFYTQHPSSHMHSEPFHLTCADENETCLDQHQSSSETDISLPWNSPESHLLSDAKTTKIHKQVHSSTSHICFNCNDKCNKYRNKAKPFGKIIQDKTDPPMPQHYQYSLHPALFSGNNSLF